MNTVDPVALARALFIHTCPLANFDAATSWDTGKAARGSWLTMARNVIHEMGWTPTLGSGASNPFDSGQAQTMTPRLPAESAAAPRSHHLSVPCPYCRAERHQPCRHTMLPGHPCDTHQARIDTETSTDTTEGNP